MKTKSISVLFWHTMPAVVVAEAGGSTRGQGNNRTEAIQTYVSASGCAFLLKVTGDGAEELPNHKAQTCNARGNTPQMEKNF